MTSVMKTLGYYMTLRYPIELNHIAEEEGGGVTACIPLLGRYSCVADGETADEAVANLKSVKADLLKDLLERGIAIPEPQEKGEYSGRFLVRMPSDLHMKIAEKAEASEESLNKYIVKVLSASVERDAPDQLSDLLLEFSKLVQAMRMQTSYYQVAITNACVVTEKSLRAMNTNWSSTPLFQSGEGQSNFDIFDILGSRAEWQGNTLFSAVRALDRK